MTGPLAARPGRPYLSSIAVIHRIATDSKNRSASVPVCGVSFPAIPRARTTMRRRQRVQFFGGLWLAVARRNSVIRKGVAPLMVIRRGRQADCQPCVVKFPCPHGRAWEVASRCDLGAVPARRFWPLFAMAQEPAFDSRAGIGRDGQASGLLFGVSRPGSDILGIVDSRWLRFCALPPHVDGGSGHRSPRDASNRRPNQPAGSPRHAQQAEIRATVWTDPVGGTVRRGGAGRMWRPMPEASPRRSPPPGVSRPDTPWPGATVTVVGVA